MKYKSLTLFLLAINFIFLPSSYAAAQENVELPEIKGAFSQEYQELKIEITNIKRMQEYQPSWRNSERARGRKIVAEPGFEIALVNINAKTLGAKSGINVNSLYLRDFKGNEYEARTRPFFIGARSESGFDSKEQDYEFPVIVPKGTQFSAVQLRQFIVKDTQPFIVHQKITFDVSEFRW